MTATRSRCDCHDAPSWTALNADDGLIWMRIDGPLQVSRGIWSVAKKHHDENSAQYRNPDRI
jgi:hypothetical protein